MAGKAWYEYAITQGYGQNGEKGVDLGTPFHTPITALFAGTVTWAGRTRWSAGGSSGGEVCIVCNLPGRGVFTSYYLHLDTANVKVGDKVPAGALIGLSGGQLSGGNWPVVNIGATFSNGPHTEFGFNAPWVSGPGHQIDPTWAIQAARNGTLPHTTVDGSYVTLGYTTGASSTTPTPVEVSPDLVAASLLAFSKVSSSTHRVITQPRGFDGLCEQLDAAEQFPDFNPMNPFGSVFGFLPAVLIRTFGVLVGLAILYMVIKEYIAGPMEAIASAGLLAAAPEAAPALLASGLAPAPATLAR